VRARVAYRATMQRVTVLVIEEGAEAGLVCAALALRPEVRVLDASCLNEALKRLEGAEPVALAIAGSAALACDAGELVTRLAARGIPVVGVTASLAPAARQRALAAGVREIHDRPAQWRSYSALIDSVVARFIPAGLPPHQGPTS
jgi:CheY-like chemotaxis protein